jgi:hypothetical protein
MSALSDFPSSPPSHPPAKEKLELPDSSVCCAYNELSYEDERDSKPVTPMHCANSPTYMLEINGHVYGFCTSCYKRPTAFAKSDGSCFLCGKKENINEWGYSQNVVKKYMLLGQEVECCNSYDTCNLIMNRIHSRFLILNEVMDLARKLRDEKSSVQLILFGGVMRDGGIDLDGKIGNPLTGAWFRAKSDVDIGYIVNPESKSESETPNCDFQSLVIPEIASHSRLRLAKLEMIHYHNSPYDFNWTHVCKAELKMMGKDFYHTVDADFVLIGGDPRVDADVNWLAWDPEHGVHIAGKCEKSRYEPASSDSVLKLAKHFHMTSTPDGENLFRLDSDEALEQAQSHFIWHIKNRLKSRTVMMDWVKIYGKADRKYYRAQKVMDKGFTIINNIYARDFAQIIQNKKKRELRDTIRKTIKWDLWSATDAEINRRINETNDGGLTKDQLNVLQCKRMALISGCVTAIGGDTENRDYARRRYRHAHSDDEHDNDPYDDFDDDGINHDQYEIQEGRIDLLDQFIRDLKRMSDARIVRNVKSITD